MGRFNVFNYILVSDLASEIDDDTFVRLSKEDRDIGLSKEECVVDQAKELSAFLKDIIQKNEMTVKNSMVFTSSYKRAIETRDRVMPKEYIQNLSSVPFDVLADVSWGNLKGMSMKNFLSIKKDFYIQIAETGYFHAQRNKRYGESFKNVVERTYPMAYYLKNQTFSNVFIFGHNVPNQALAYNLLDRTDIRVSLDEERGSVKLLTKNSENSHFVDRGYVFKGFPKEISYSY
jgi:broad specificity phosphatase PhoE